MVSKIEQIIEEIEELIDSSKYAAFSSTKILVDKEEIDELLQELKNHTPDEIARCQKIISNKEAILADAQNKADALLKEAQVFSDHMVSEHEVLQQAYAQAGEIVNQAKLQAQDIVGSATEQANNIQTGAIQYTDDSLANIQQILMASIQETQENNNNLISSLSQILDVVNANRAELQPGEEEFAETMAVAERAEAERLMNGMQDAPEMAEGMSPEYAAAENPAPATAAAIPEAAAQSVSAPAQTAAPAANVPSSTAPAAGAAAAEKADNTANTSSTVSSAAADTASPRSGGIIKGGISKAILEGK